MTEVTKNTDEHRFELRVEGELAGRLDYEVGSHGVVRLVHTVVEDRFSGRGLAGDLVRVALDDVRAEGYLVEPVCSYVAKWLKENPEYADIVAPADQESPRDTSPETVEDVTGVDPERDPRI